MFYRFKAASTVAVSVATIAAFAATDASVAGEIAGSQSGSALINATVSFPDIAHQTTLTLQDAEQSQEVDSEPSLPMPGGSDEGDTPMNKAANLAALVEMTPAPQALDAQTRCLAGAVYFESKGESLTGQLAVARVVINRARSGRFPSSICGVVLQPSQFSFVRRGAIPAINTTSRDWKEALAIAQIALNNAWKNPAEGALFFHARYVSPGWKLRKVAVVENHIFYR
jgi:spore germination cell wall hydrolase CwlJ-like protein